MNYPEDIKMIVEMEMRNLIRMIEQNEKPFNFDYINDYLMRYFEIISNKQV